MESNLPDPPPEKSSVEEGIAVIMESNQPDPPPEKPSAEEGIDFRGLYRNEWDTWARTGKLGATALRADLPDVVQGLKDGKIDPERFAKCLTWQEMLLARQGVEKIPCTGKGPDWPTFETCAVECLSRDIIDSYNKSNASTALAEFFKNFKEELLKELNEAKNLSPDHQSLQKYKPGFFGADGSDWDAFRETDYFGLLHYAFERVGKRHEAEMKKLTGRTAKKVSRSKIYKATKRHFDACMNHWIKIFANKESPEFKEYNRRTELVETKRMQIFSAADAVQKGDDVFNKMCWECNTASAAHFKCGGCGEARYCCKEHQCQAWQGGHRNSCKLMKSIRDSFSMNLKRMEATAKDDNIISDVGKCELKPCLDFDVRIAWFFALSHSSRSKDWVDRFGHPTMENFYQNLADIYNGERHFLFPDTPDPTLKDIGPGDVKVGEPDEFDYGASICKLAAVMGYRPTSAEDKERLLEKANERMDRRGTTHLETARDFILDYKFCQTTTQDRCWKDIKKGQLYLLRRTLHEDYHKLPEKPSGY